MNCSSVFSSCSFGILKLIQDFPQPLPQFSKGAISLING
jgi:hypothetical protein